MIQLAIIACSALSIYFLARPDRTRRYGFIASLCGQPFWIATSLAHGQYGITLLSGWFIYCNCRGLWRSAVEAVAKAEERARLVVTINPGHTNSTGTHFNQCSRPSGEIQAIVQ
jgi:hypothetical protein